MNLFDYNGLSFKDSKIKKTDLGIAYVGNKRVMSYDILRYISAYYPQVKTIYDLFGGAGGFAFNALANGYEVVYNELAEYPFSLAKFATENKDTPKEVLEFCSREEFKAIKAKERKSTIDYVKLFMYSFRCAGGNYFCSPQKEFFKRQGHNMVVFQDKEAISFWNDYFKVESLFNEYLTFGIMPLKKRLDIYVNTMLKIESLSVVGVLHKFQKERNAYTISDFSNIKTKEVCAYVEKNMPKDTPLKNYKTKKYEAYLDDMRKLEQLQQLHQLEQLQQLERLTQLQQLQQKSSMKLYNLDYRKVEIPNREDILIYCDIPYKGLSDEYHIKFNHAEFYKWALKMAKQGFKVLISEYDMPLSDFECVYYKKILNPRNKDKSCEKIFIPKIKKNV